MIFKNIIQQDKFNPCPRTATSVRVSERCTFKAGDLVRPHGFKEVIFIKSVKDNQLEIIRRYGNTDSAALKNNQRLVFLGNIHEKAGSY